MKYFDAVIRGNEENHHTYGVESRAGREDWPFLNSFSHGILERLLSKLRKRLMRK